MLRVQAFWVDGRVWFEGWVLGPGLKKIPTFGGSSQQRPV